MLPSLLYAAARGRAEFVRRILDQGTDVNLRGERGYTALILAACGCHAEILRLLIESKADTRMASEVGMTACMGVVCGYLHLHGIYEWDEERTYPAQEERIDALLVLLNAGADIDAADRWGRTTLLHAASNAQEKVVSFLLFRNADVNKSSLSGETALMETCRWNNTETSGSLINLLIRRGADVDAMDAHGFTALMCAAWLRRSDIVHCLLSHQANIQLRDAKGRSALKWARLTAQDLEAEKPADPVEALFDKGWHGKMPANPSWARQEDSTAIVEILKNAGATE